MQIRSCFIQGDGGEPAARALSGDDHAYVAPGRLCLPDSYVDTVPSLILRPVILLRADRD
jgi:hypothetical protein